MSLMVLCLVARCARGGRASEGLRLDRYAARLWKMSVTPTPSRLEGPEGPRTL